MKYLRTLTIIILIALSAVIGTCIGWKFGEIFDPNKVENVK